MDWVNRATLSPVDPAAFFPKENSTIAPAMSKCLPDAVAMLRLV
jgi:hypothetical protein